MTAVIVVGALLGFMGLAPATAATPDPRIEQAQANKTAYCTALVDDATNASQRSTRADLCAMWTRELADLMATPTPTTTAPATSTLAPTTVPPTTVPATTQPPTPTPTPTNPPAGSWPDASSTGVPAPVSLTNYTGSCTITIADTVIDSKIVNCSTLSIRANNVTIVRSRINGSIENGSEGQPSRRFSVTDSDIIAGVDSTGIAESYFTALRVDISGGNRGANCFTDCVVQDSYIHGNRVSCSVAVCGDNAPHASGLRAGMNTTYVHNYMQCTVGGNCSADLTGYPDFSITINWDIRNNFFGAVTDAQWCAYDGSVGGKPYSNAAGNGTYIRFVDNVFARGNSRRCGVANPVADDGSRYKVGWVFTGNKYEDGVSIPTP